MKRFAMSAVVAGGLVAAALGSAGAAAATELYFGADGAGVTATDGSGVMFGQNGFGMEAADGSGIAVGPRGFTVSLPDTDHSANRHYDANRRYDSWNGNGYDPYYGGYGPCAPGYCR